MGKRLIIKGANFSSVAVDKEVVTRWVFEDITWGTHTSDASNSKGYGIYGRCFTDYNWNLAAGKKIIGIKVNVKSVGSGRCQIGVIRGARQLYQSGQDVSVPNLESITELQELNVTTTGVQTIMLSTPIVLTENDWIGIGNFTIDVTSVSLPVFWMYPEHYFAAAYGPNETSNPNKIRDKYGSSGWAGFLGIDYLYEVE